MMAKMDRSCLYILAFFFSYTNVSRAKDTLQAGQVLNGGDFLESNNKRFQFLVDTWDPYAPIIFIRYVYNNDSMIFWHVNPYPERPDEDAVSVRMDENGELVCNIRDGFSSYIINNAQTVMVRSTRATLLDNGNLVLVADQGRVVWQSFDYPCETWLQGMKLGTFGLSTSRQISSGLHSFGVDPGNQNQLIATREGKVYWRSATSNRQNPFLEFLAASRFDVAFTEVLHTDGTYYFTFTSDSDPFAFVRLDEDGKIHLSPGNLSAKSEAIINLDVWDKYLYCNDYNGTFDGWNKYSFCNFENVVRYCGELCRRNCSCTGYAFASLGDFHYECKFSGSRRFVDGKIGETFYFRKSLVLDRGMSTMSCIGSDSAHGLSRGKKVKLFLGATAAALVVFSFLYTFCQLQRRNNHFQAISRLIGVQKLKHNDKGDEDSLSFSFASIEVATDQFSDENKLGEGGFGPVYKGVLLSGQEIAVKRLHKITRHGEEQFKNEVAVISKLQHQNLVRLLGYCIHNEERILVYEYLPNNSLDSILFGAKERTILDWKPRLHIIEGVAQGLLYLHRYSRLKIIHRDLKTSNILLDTNLNPKISDFGTAKIFGDEFFSASTNRIAGTLGYMSPEYAVNGIFSTRSDVFSFGIIVLEIISGKKNSFFYSSDRYISLLAYGWDFWIQGRALDIVDPNLVETNSNQVVLRYVQVGLLCVQENAADRPTMLAVVSMITNESMILPAPKEPGFSAVMGPKNDNVFEKPEVFSVNKVTISYVEGR